MVDTNELRQLAEAATPGPWKVGQYLGSPRQFVIHMDVGDKGRGSDIAFTSASFDNDETIANASLIAAANPAAINELLDRLEAAEKERDALRAELEARKKQESVIDTVIDYLVSISAHVAHQDDATAQAEIGDLLKMLAAGAQGELK